jgi:hypothetical protein
MTSRQDAIALVRAGTEEAMAPLAALSEGIAAIVERIPPEDRHVACDMLRTVAKRLREAADRIDSTARSIGGGGAAS